MIHSGELKPGKVTKFVSNKIVQLDMINILDIEVVAEIEILEDKLVIWLKKKENNAKSN